MQATSQDLMDTSLRSYASLLGRYLSTQRSRMVLLALLAVSGIGLELLAPQLVQNFIDTALAGGATEILVQLALLFVGVTLIQQVFTITGTYVAETVAWTATNALRTDLVLHCLGLDQAFHKEHTPGELIERIDSDVTALANLFALFVIHILSNLLLLVGVLAVLYWQDWRIGLMFNVMALVTLGILIGMRDIAVPFWEKASQASADLFGFLEERLGGTEDIRANGGVAYMMRQFFELMRARLHIERKATLVNGALIAARLALEGLSLVLVLVVGVLLFDAGHISIGTIYLLVYYNRLLYGPLEQIMDQIRELQHAGASLKRVRQLLQTRSNLPASGQQDLASGALSLAFRDVSFSYQRHGASAPADLAALDGFPPAEHGQHEAPAANRAPEANDAGPDGAETDLVLRNISFQLEPGRVLGLLGHTGSGKTTLTRLVVRLIDPTAGQVEIGGSDARDIRLAELRRRVGVVTQEVQLFEGTIRDNITFFDRTIPDRRLHEVIEQLGLEPWYRTLNGGLDTLISNTRGLSAGEAQLLALIRIFLKDPGIVILDEASSRLDPTTERLLDGAISSLLRGRTAIIIAHRLTTVQSVDEIMILKQGAIVEYGRRADLIRSPQSQLSHLLQVGLEEALP